MAASRTQSRIESSDQPTTSGTNEISSSLNLLALTGPENLYSSSLRKPAANDELLQVLKLDVNTSMGSTPEWMPRKMQNPAPDVQCASTASNIYREAMLASHVIDSTDSAKYRDLMQVQVPNWVNAMKQAGLAEEIQPGQIRPGDVVVGLGGLAGTPDHSDRHIGFVGDFDNQTHHFSAYSNAMGTLRQQDLDARFAAYREEHFYRIYLPE